MSGAPETLARDAVATPGAPPTTAADATRSSVVLVGNPNVGKSVIFGLLTGRYVTVSNYPGTTVTVSRGRLRGSRRRFEVIDTPGVNSLVPMSEDERVTRDILLDHEPAAVVQVADAKNLRRALLITTQLAEMGIPFSLDLNMTDEAEDLGLKVNRDALEEKLGVRVEQTVAVRRKGFDRLRDSLEGQRRCSLEVRYPQAVETAIEAVTPLLPESHIARRGLAIMFLSGDPSMTEWLQPRVGEVVLEELCNIRRGAAGVNGSLASAINRARLRAVDAIVSEVAAKPRRKPGSFAGKVGDYAMHPFWGVPVLLAVLWAMYQFVGVLGAGMAVDFLESTIFGKYIAPWAIHAADFIFRFPHEHGLEDGILLPDYVVTAQDLSVGQQTGQFLHDILVGPYGQITMALSYALALILPIVTTFFIAFGLLEDSGYLPRLSVMLNRIFRSIGLNGKAVLPMVLGLGCDTMATLTTRILETRKERILVTLLLALGVPCSAQLGVILGMIRALSLGATLIWGGAILATMFAVGWIGSKLVPGDTSDFILELPPIRRPQLGNILIKTMARIEWYLREAVPLFLLGTLLLFLMDWFRILGVVERMSAPVVSGILGLPTQATEAFLIGFLRRDYGAAGLYDLARQGLLDPIQIVVAMVTITLFVPCIANFFIMIKERGAKTALAMVAVIVPLAFLVGGALNFGLRALGVSL